MAEPGMQPEADDPQLLGDPEHIDASLTWTGSSVSISLPKVGTENASGASWNSSNLSENSSTSRWDSSTSNATGNTLDATYGRTHYKKTTIKRGDTSAKLDKQ